MSSAKTPIPWLPASESKALFRCACLALLLELCSLEVVGWRAHWFSHRQNAKGLDATKFIETQMVQLPEEARLTSKHPDLVKKEAVISKIAGNGRKETFEDKKSLENSDKNVTKTPSNASALGPTHGPVALYNPSPVIPSYLTNQELKSTVVIEFTISALGYATPRLIASSDNEELDAIAIATAKRWKFRPAEQEHKPIDSKIRLRIVFEVH